MGREREDVDELLKGTSVILPVQEQASKTFY